MGFVQHRLVLRADGWVMSDLNGLPDFQTPSLTPATSTFPAFQSGSYSVLPQQLALSVNDDGSPKFQLDIVKRIGDFSSAGQYAVLDFSLSGDFSLDKALAQVRSHDPSATVKPIAIDGGFARLYRTAGEVAPGSDVLAPVSLGLSGSDYARWTTRLSADAGELIKGAIAGGSILLGARVEFDVVGVAPRVDASVEFEPARLTAALLAGRQGRMLSTSDVVAAFTGAPENFPLKIEGGAPSGDFGGAVASRIFASFATLAPAPGIGDPPCVVFNDESQLPAGTIQWDLSQAALGRGQWVLTLDVLTTLRALAAQNGIESLVRYVSVPALQVGFCNVDVEANLPQNRLGVPAIGATVSLPANPPLRPSSISQTVTFAEPVDTGSVQFRISPAERLTYTVSGFAVVAAGQIVREYQMPPQPRTDAWVQLGADDFPVTFAHVTAAERLLALATLSVVLTYVLDGQPCQLQFVLKEQVAGVAMAVPRAASAASMTISASARDGSAALVLPPTAPGRIELDVTNFREFGPHRISIAAALTGGDPLLSLDFLAQQQDPSEGAVPDGIFLTAEQPNATWGFVASSPFQAGYRYRRSALAHAPAGPWSPVLSPFAPLVLAADGTNIAGANATQPTPQAVPAAT